MKGYMLILSKDQGETWEKHTGILGGPQTPSERIAELLQEMKKRQHSAKDAPETDYAIIPHGFKLARE